MTTTRTIKVYLENSSPTHPYYEFVETVTAPSMHTLVYELDYGFVTFRQQDTIMVIPANKINSIKIENKGK